MSPFDQVIDPLRIVTTAVTPVVMVSATAILISGVNARYLAVSDRMRTLAREYREEAISTARQANIQQQMVLFHRRLYLVSWSSRILYVAVFCFIAVALLICLSTWREMLNRVTLPIFVLGVFFVGAAIVLQLMEVNESHKTVELEASEVLTAAGQNHPD